MSKKSQNSLSGTDSHFAQATYTTQDWTQTPPALDNGDSLRDCPVEESASCFRLSLALSAVSGFVRV
jgi:hypothetical protein